MVGADTVREALRKAVLESGMQNQCQVKGVGCMGLCSAGPLVLTEPEGHLYAGVAAEDAGEIVGNLDTGATEGAACDPSSPFFARCFRAIFMSAGSGTEGARSWRSI